MNWYMDKFIVDERIADMHSEREMDRLAEAAQGKAPFVIGLEDLLSARELVSEIAFRATSNRPSKEKAPALRPARAQR